MKRVIAVFLCVMLMLPCVSALGEVYVDQTPPADWEQRDLMLRTGESDCMLMEAGGEAMMIDGGANKWREKLRDALAERGITHLKYIYNTHPHDDHIDGLYRIMQYGVTADEFVSIFAENFRNDLHARTVKQAAKSGIPFRQLQVGDTLTLQADAFADGVWLEFGHADCVFSRNGFSLTGEAVTVTLSRVEGNPSIENLTIRCLNDTI